MERLAREQVSRIAKEKNFKNYSIQIESGSELGFIGVLKRFVITEDERKFSLMCKFMPKDKEQNARFNSMKLFEREVFAYQQVLLEFEKMQLENGFEYRDSNGFWAYPKCYFSHYDQDNPSNSIIIMEDLTIENFAVVPQPNIPSNFNHTQKLFVELAKFHALSFVMKAKKAETFKTFKHMKNNMLSVMTTESMKHLAPRNIQLAAKVFEEEKEIRDKILSFKDNLWERVRENNENDLIEPYAVVCHGDMWTNNALYNEDGDIRIVDWQIMNYGSPCTELTYYMYCCLNKVGRDEFGADLLNIYYETMRDFLQKFEMNIDQVFPIEIFHDHLQKFSLYGFAMTTYALPLITKYPEALLEDKNASITDEERKCVSYYREFMRDNILDMIAMKII